MTVEYLVITGTVALGFMFALVGLGPMLVADYNETRSRVMHPFE